MPTPSHEQVPAGKGKRGRRPQTTPSVALDRVVDVGQLMFGSKMTPTQIYAWNKRENPKDPNHLEKWNFSLRQIIRMCQQARAQGSSLLGKDLKEAYRISMMGYADLQRKCIAAGDFRVAFLCEREMSRMRGTHDRKAAPGRTLGESVADAPAHKWADPDAPEATDAEFTERPDFDGMGIS